MCNLIGRAAMMGASGNLFLWCVWVGDDCEKKKKNMPAAAADADAKRLWFFGAYCYTYIRWPNSQARHVLIIYPARFPTHTRFM